jgi:peptidoglycan/xylan/chitin deacetylase (PgdA/CDA1 family)
MMIARTNCKVLLYHSQNVQGNDYASNDHVALAEDLRLIQELGLKVVPLNWLVGWLLGDCQLDVHKCVCISFDDGVDADVRDLDFPGHGRQRSFLNVMRDFHDEFGFDAQPMLHATSFVIASPDARAVMDRHSLFDQGWMSEKWWGEDHDGLLAIANHGWDHAHPDLRHLGERPDGHFHGVDDRHKADRQVVDAAEYIAAQTGGRQPGLFAYPYGHVNDYLPGEYFPDNAHHGTRAAFTTEPAPVEPGSDRWRLGRYVCGRDWRSSAELEMILLS